MYSHSLSSCPPLTAWPVSGMTSCSLFISIRDGKSYRTSNWCKRLRKSPVQFTPWKFKKLFPLLETIAWLGWLVTRVYSRQLFSLSVTLKISPVHKKPTIFNQPRLEKVRNSGDEWCLNIKYMLRTFFGNDCDCDCQIHVHCRLTAHSTVHVIMCHASFAHCTQCCSLVFFRDTASMLPTNWFNTVPPQVVSSRHEEGERVWGFLRRPGKRRQTTQRLIMP